MKRSLHFATGNAHKLAEFRLALEAAFGPKVELKSLLDYPELPVPVENGATLTENAFIKARALHAYCGGLCVADDTGLLVDALGGAPGVHSARWAGAGCSYDDNVRKMCAAITPVPPDKRLARFETVLAVVGPRGLVAELKGVCEGIILDSPRGEGGFGYDPIFFLPELGHSFAELTLADKNVHSHRGRAVRALVEWLREKLYW